jgi:hypothetical protein
VSRPAPFETAELPLVEEAFEPSPAVQRRRLYSARVRRRRLLLADAGIGALLGLLALVIAPGMAIAALGALLVLAGCAIAVVRERRGGRRRRRIRLRRLRSTGRRGSQPKNSSAVS